MHALQMLIEDCGFETQSYSGRGMYGKYCLGVAIERGGLGNFMAEVIQAASEMPGMYTDAFKGMSEDTLGLGRILYFPDVPFEGSDDEDEGSDVDDSMDGDHESALASAGFGTDEDYGSFGDDRLDK